MNRSYKKMLILLGVCGISFVALTFGYYVYKFGSDVIISQEKWGQFGDFLGGTTNPILALLTFIGVLWTISMTHDEREDLRIQDKKSDIYRIIETINNDLISLFNMKLISSSVVKGNNYITGDYVSFAELLKMQKNEVRWADLVTSYSCHLGDINTQLVFLKFYLLQYDDLSQNSFVSDYYRIYYMPACFQLQDLDLIDKKTVEFYEDPKNTIIQDQLNAFSTP